MANIDSAAGLWSVLEDRRKTLGITQRDLCKRAGLSHATYWYAANRGGDVTLRAILGYCNVLGLTLKVTKGRTQ